MGMIEEVIIDLGVLVLSSASALAIGHLFLSVVVKDRRG